MTTNDPRTSGILARISNEVTCSKASDVLDEFFGESRSEQTDPADPYRAASHAMNDREPRLLGADLLWLDGKEVWFELVMEPLQTGREITLLCRLVADWMLPHPLYIRLDMGDFRLEGVLDARSQTVGWIVGRQDVLDPKSPGRTRRPVKLRVSPTPL